MNDIRHLSVIAVLAASLVGCGGSSNDEPSSALDRANEAENRVRSLLQTEVCSADSQCSYVTIEDAFPSCSQGTHLPYLLISRSAKAAEVAAAEQRTLARESRFAPGNNWNFACLASVAPPPVPYCEQQQCKLRYDLQLVSIPLQ